MTIWGYIGLYLVAGIVAMGLLDLITGMIRKRLRDLSYDTQSKLIESGSLVGMKTAIFITVLILWIFWPLAIYSAVRG